MIDRPRLDEWCEKGILGLVLLILIFGPLAMGAVRSSEFLVIQVLTLGIVLLWLARFWLGVKYRLLWPPICWGVVVFVGYAIVRYQTADIEYVAREELIRILIYALLFFAILNNLHHQMKTQMICFVLVFLGMAISFYALYQFLTYSKWIWTFPKPPGYLNRGSGTYICPNHTAGFLEMILPLGLAYGLTGRLSHTLKIFLIYASMAVLVGIGVTISRGGWIATGLSLLVFFIALVRQRQFRLPAFLLLVVVAASCFLFVVKNQYSKQRFETALVDGKVENIRFELWQPAIQLWRDHPWWGAGPAHFDYRFRPYRPADVQGRPDRVHNDYLNTLADWGLIGLVLVLVALGLLFTGVLQIWRLTERSGKDLGDQKSNRRSLTLGASVGLVAILLHSAVDFNMHIPANAIVAITLMALLTSLWRFGTDRFWITPGWIGRILATLVLSIALVYLGRQGLLRWKESALLKRADAPGIPERDRIATLKEAHRLDPLNFETTYQIGETLRMVSWRGDAGYEDWAYQAIGWFEKAIQTDPYEPYNYVRIGMCLDWMGKHKEAEPFFQRAKNLDPNGYLVVAQVGWHYFQIADYATAKIWFERSLTLQPRANRVASSYIKIVNRRLAELRSTQ